MVGRLRFFLREMAKSIETMWRPLDPFTGVGIACAMAAEIREHLRFERTPAGNLRVTDLFEENSHAVFTSLMDATIKSQVSPVCQYSCPGVRNDFVQAIRLRILSINEHLDQSVTLVVPFRIAPLPPMPASSKAGRAQEVRVTHNETHLLQRDRRTDNMRTEYETNRNDMWDSEQTDGATCV